MIERFGDPDGIGVLEETGTPKKGIRSVGVAKQYCGAVGKLENCQVATLLTYASPRGHVFLDRRLYLPESWCWDRARRLRAHIPATERFQTKLQQARAMLEHTWELGVPMRWVTGDSVYGDSPDLRAAIQAAGWSSLRSKGPSGRPRRAVRLAKDAPKAKTVAEVIAALPKGQWKRSICTGTREQRRTRIQRPTADACVVAPREWPFWKRCTRGKSSVRRIQRWGERTQWHAPDA